jgi:hypothetical protein
MASGRRGAQPSFRSCELKRIGVHLRSEPLTIRRVAAGAGHTVGYEAQ